MSGVNGRRCGHGHGLGTHPSNLGGTLGEVERDSVGGFMEADRTEGNADVRRRTGKHGQTAG